MYAQFTNGFAFKKYFVLAEKINYENMFKLDASKCWIEPIFFFILYSCLVESNPNFCYI